MRVLAAAVALGLLAGIAGALLQAPRYRAGGALVVAPALARTDPALSTLTRTAVELVQTRAVAENVVGALGLHESPDTLRRRIHAHARRGTAVVDVDVTAKSALEAQRTAQEVVTVFARLAAARLGAQGGGAPVTPWDAPGSAATRVGRPFAAWGIGGASLGLLAGALAVLALGRRPEQSPTVAREPVEQVPGTDESVPGTEVAVQAPPASAAAPGFVEQVPGTDESVPGTEVAVQAPAESERAPVPAAGLIAELERRAAAAAPGERAGLLVYVDELRSFADSDGNLPANFLPLVEDVFGAIS